MDDFLLPGWNAGTAFQFGHYFFASFMRQTSDQAPGVKFLPVQIMEKHDGVQTCPEFSTDTGPGTFWQVNRC